MTQTPMLVGAHRWDFWWDWSHWRPGLAEARPGRLDRVGQFVWCVTDLP